MKLENAPPALMGAASADPRRPPPRKRLKTPVLRIGLGMTSVMLLLVALYTSSPDGIVRESLPLLLVALGLQLMPFIWQRDLDPFSPVILNTFNIILTFAGTIATLFVTKDIEFGGLVSVGYDDAVGLMNAISMVYIIATVAYYAGFYIPSGRSQNLFPTLSTGWIPSRYWLVMVACAACFVGAYAVFQSRLGIGLTTLTMYEGKEVWRNENDGMAWMFRAIGLGALAVLFAVARLFQPGAPKRTIRRVVLTSASVVVIGFLLMRLGVRSLVAYYLLSIGIVIHYCWKRIPTSVIVAGGFIVVVAAVILGDLRNRNEQDASLGPSHFDATHVLVRHEQDRARLAGAAVVLDTFPRKMDYLKGESFLALLISPIPRVLWPGKRQFVVMSDSGIVYTLTGAPLPLSFPFVLYANFGWIGIAVGMGLWGAFHRSLFEWMSRRRQNVAVCVMYSLVIIYFAPTAIGMGTAIGTVLPGWIAMKFMGARAARLKTNRVLGGAGPVGLDAA